MAIDSFSRRDLEGAESLVELDELIDRANRRFVERLSMSMAARSCASGGCGWSCRADDRANRRPRGRHRRADRLSADGRVPRVHRRLTSGQLDTPGVAAEDAFDRHRKLARGARPRAGHRAHRHRGRLLGRAGTLAAVVLPRPRGGIEPSPRETRHRSIPRRPRVLRVRLVQQRAEEARRADARRRLSAPDHLLPGGDPRAAPGRDPSCSRSRASDTASSSRASSAGTSTRTPPYFLTFLVAVHLATALVLLGFFWSDWVRIVKGLGRSACATARSPTTRREARLAARHRHDPRRNPRAPAAGLPAATSSPRRSTPRSSSPSTA